MQSNSRLHLHSPTSSTSSPPVTPSHTHPARQSPFIFPPQPPPRKLLIPTSRPSRIGPSSPRSIRVKTTGGKRIRARSASIPIDFPPPVTSNELCWFHTACKFEVVQEELTIDGYQIYAVEKWIVQRTSPVTLLTVFTGDPKDKITVTVLSPAASLSSTDASAEWEKALHDLRRDGARPRETDQGTIMVTSLANFRSDFTIVLIPDGNFLAHREQLYANINLLRMGSSGRSALTLQESSDATKDRFLSMYNFRDSLRSQGPFTATVLELVKVIQCGLALFDMFPLAIEEHNGLLCDKTVDGIQRWVAEIGEPYLKVEPMERVADPTTVSALLSLLVATRNKLRAIGLSHVVPQDPFLNPYLFMHAIATFANHRHHQQIHLPLHTTNSSSTSVSSAPATRSFLTLPLIRRLDIAYEKARASDAYKVHRVLLNKLDDLTTATTSAISSSPTIPSASTGADGVDATSDVAAFATKMGAVGGKDGVGSLRYLWTGRPDQLDRKRKEALWNDGERDDEKERTDGKSTEEECEVFTGIPWSGKMQRKIESWAGREFGRSKSKKPSTDHFRAALPGDDNLALTSAVPSVIVSRDHEDPTEGISSGQVSPISPSTSMLGLGILPSAQASSLHMENSEYERRVTQFNQARPPIADTWNSGLTTWSDPLGAHEIFDEGDLATAKAGAFVSDGYFTAANSFGEEPHALALDEISHGVRQARRPLLSKLRRRFSFDDAEWRRGEKRLPVARMELDVNLYAQYLIMRRRETRVEGLIASLQAIAEAVATTNDALRRDYDMHQQLIKDVCAQAEIVTEIETARFRADEITRDAHALAYEALGFDVPRLWQMAQVPRQRVFAIRERVSGTSARVPSTHSHGRFNRVQVTADRKERLVDWMGRTEGEVEEERDLPEIMPDEQIDDAQVATQRPSSGWLLAFFTRWGKVLGVGAGKDVPQKVEVTDGVANESDGGDHLITQLNSNGRLHQQTEGSDEAEANISDDTQSK